MNPKELAEYLNISINTVYLWSRLNFLPHIKMGGSLKFDHVDIDGWVEERKIKPFDFEKTKLTAKVR